MSNEVTISEIGDPHLVCEILDPFRIHGCWGTPEVSLVLSDEIASSPNRLLRSFLVQRSIPSTPKRLDFDQLLRFDHPIEILQTKSSTET